MLYHAVSSDTQVLVLDIETRANLATCDLMPAPQAPRHYKDPEKITDYIEARRGAAIQTMATDLDLCTVAALGWACGVDAPVEVLLTHDEHEERAVLKLFWELVAPAVCIVGYNVRSFDLPILLRRSMVLGLVPSRSVDLRPFSRDVKDLMTLLYPHGKWRSLKFICSILGIANPLPEVDGSQVESMSDKELRAYCANDVRLTQALARRAAPYFS